MFRVLTTEYLLLVEVVNLIYLKKPTSRKNMFLAIYNLNFFFTDLISVFRISKYFFIKKIH